MILAVIAAFAGLAAIAVVAWKLSKAHNPPVPKLSYLVLDVEFYDMPVWFRLGDAYRMVDEAMKAWPDSPWSRQMWGRRGIVTNYRKQNWSGSPGQTQGNASKVCVAGMDQASALNEIRHEICHQPLNALGIVGDAAHAEIRRVFGVSA